MTDCSRPPSTFTDEEAAVWRPAASTTKTPLLNASSHLTPPPRVERRVSTGRQLLEERTLKKRTHEEQRLHERRQHDLASAALLSYATAMRARQQGRWISLRLQGVHGGYADVLASCVTPRYFLFFWHRAFKETLPRLKVSVCLPLEMFATIFPLLAAAACVLIVQSIFVLSIALAYPIAMVAVPVVFVLCDDRALALLGLLALNPMPLVAWREGRSDKLPLVPPTLALPGTGAGAPRASGTNVLLDETAADAKEQQAEQQQLVVAIADVYLSNGTHRQYLRYFTRWSQSIIVQLLVLAVQLGFFFSPLSGPLFAAAAHSSAGTLVARGATGWEDVYMAWGLLCLVILGGLAGAQCIKYRPVHMDAFAQDLGLFYYTTTSHDGTAIKREKLRGLLMRFVDAEAPRGDGDVGGDTKFSRMTLVMGQPKDAALGISRYLNRTDEDIDKVIWAGMGRGMAAIEEEWAAAGTDDDRVCLEYVLHGRAGEHDRRWKHAGDKMMDVFDNPANRDGRHGRGLSYFVQHPHARAAGLLPEHVVALRLYTTAAYRSINAPLRRSNEPGAAPHPFPVTVAYLTDGIKRLRAVHAVAEDAYDAGDYWRGMRDVEVLDDFYSGGGTELAPMSTSRDLNVALHYSAKAQVRLIFKIATDSFMSRGASLLFLSAFPDEVEFLYPPLTFLQPTGNEEIIITNGIQYRVIEVIPNIAS